MSDADALCTIVLLVNAGFAVCVNLHASPLLQKPLRTKKWHVGPPAAAMAAGVSAGERIIPCPGDVAGAAAAAAAAAADDDDDDDNEDVAVVVEGAVAAAAVDPGPSCEYSHAAPLRHAFFWKKVQIAFLPPSAAAACCTTGFFFSCWCTEGGGTAANFGAAACGFLPSLLSSSSLSEDDDDDDEEEDGEPARLRWLLIPSVRMRLLESLLLLLLLLLLLRMFADDDADDEAGVIPVGVPPLLSRLPPAAGVEGAVEGLFLQTKRKMREEVSE